MKSTSFICTTTSIKAKLGWWKYILVGFFSWVRLGWVFFYFVVVVFVFVSVLVCAFVWLVVSASRFCCLLFDFNHTTFFFVCVFLFVTFSIFPYTILKKKKNYFFVVTWLLFVFGDYCFFLFWLFRFNACSYTHTDWMSWFVVWRLLRLFLLLLSLLFNPVQYVLSVALTIYMPPSSSFCNFISRQFVFLSLSSF